MMPTYVWILLVLAAYFLGFLSCAILTAGSDADDWMDGYWAARRDMERERKKREGGGE
jgi:phosphatidylglycerophosphate synthase